MFLKTQKKPAASEADHKRNQLRSKVLCAAIHLEERVERVIVCQHVIDLYPDGPDKERAEKDLEYARYSMICAIGTYDDVRSELTRYVKDHRSEFVTTANNDGSRGEYTSHNVVEDTWRRFYKRR